MRFVLESEQLPQTLVERALTEHVQHRFFRFPREHAKVILDVGTDVAKMGYVRSSRE